jgi:hypothetical protein
MTRVNLWATGTENPFQHRSNMRYADVVTLATSPFAAAPTGGISGGGQQGPGQRTQKPARSLLTVPRIADHRFMWIGFI